MRNPKGAKSDRQEKVIVAENSGNLVILAGYLNLIQSKLSFQESRFRERKTQDNKLTDLIWVKEQ